MHRILLMIVGSLAFAIGTLGLYIPGLPTTVFYLLAAYCLARSNDRLYQKLVTSKHYKALIHDPFVERKMTLKKKWQMFLTMGIVFGIGIIFVPVLWKIVLLVIYLAHVIGLSWYWAKKK